MIKETIEAASGARQAVNKCSSLFNTLSDDVRHTYMRRCQVMGNDHLSNL